jgi:hypothetical protein
VSRSRRNTPICPVTTSESEKDDKRLANRALRRRTKQKLAVEPEAEVLPVLREVSDPWSMDKDGKMRFDPARYPKTMRK